MNRGCANFKGKGLITINSAWDKVGHCMCMFSGVKLYYGPNEKEYFAQIQCFRGGGGDIYIINFAGTPIWAKRDAILRAGYYVRKNDPALKAMNYYECD